MFHFLLLLLLCSLPAYGQLISAGSPLPKSTNPPVIFLNGYQNDCTGSDFAGTFGQFDQVLQRAGRVSVFFDNCSYPGKPAIEELGNRFAAFLSSLIYQDGTPVTQVDVVMHSMGGLIVRSYLAGKQISGSFQPPDAPPIRKAIFIATPNAGTALPVQLLGNDQQVLALGLGSQFLFDLLTWNQGTDDLRGVDALAIVGSGGTGKDTMAGFDDGIVSLTSGSIGFALPNRTRIISACHTKSDLLIFAGYCPSSAPAIASVTSDSDPVAQMVVSFLANTATWQTIGQAAEQNAALASGGGLALRAKSAADDFLSIDSATVSKTLNVADNKAVAYTELLSSQSQDLIIQSGMTTLRSSLTVQPGFTNAVVAKDGPQIARVLPSAAAVFPLSVAPASYISIYGKNFGTGTVAITDGNFPTMLNGAQVLVNGTALRLIVVTPNQINAILPSAISGLATVSVVNAAGKHTLNVLVQPVVPTIFTQDGSGAGPASALNGVTGSLVNSSTPLHAGDYVSLFLTGLGAIAPNFYISPTVTVGGQACPVSYAGLAPGYDALDQINCQIPAGIASGNAQVVVTSAGRASNVATLAIQ